jgi:hypothetical protein
MIWAPGVGIIPAASALALGQKVAIDISYWTVTKCNFHSDLDPFERLIGSHYHFVRVVFDKIPVPPVPGLIVLSAAHGVQFD